MLSNTVRVNGKDVRVESDLPSDVTAKALSSGLMEDWTRSIDPRIRVESIRLQNVDMFGPRVGFLKFSAEAYLDNNPYKIPGPETLVSLVIDEYCCRYCFCTGWCCGHFN